MRTLLIVAAFALCLMSATTACLSSDGQAYGASVSGESLLTDSNCWSYLVKNTSNGGSFALWLIQIEVDPDTTVVTADGPDGWTADTKEPHFIKWTVDTDAATELMSGESSSQFTATFTSTPGYQNWSAMLDSKDGTDLTVADGGEVILQSVPEPGGIVAVFWGLVSLNAMRKRKSF